MPIFSNVVILFNDEAFIVVGQLNEGNSKNGIRLNLEQNVQTYNTVLAWVKALGTRLSYYLQHPCMVHDVVCDLRAHKGCAQTIRANVHFVIIIS